MVTDEEGVVEICLSRFERAAFLSIAVGCAFGSAMRFFVSPYDETGDIITLYVITFLMLPIAFWFGISMWIVGGEYLYRADSSGVKTGYSGKAAFLPFYKDSQPKFVAWNLIAALEWRSDSGAKRPTPMLVNAEGEILLGLLLNGRPKSERERFLNFIQTKIDADRS